MMMRELDLIADADARARLYLEGVAKRPPFPSQAAREGLSIFKEGLPEQGHDATDTLRLLDIHGSPATTASNGPRYFGFVVGAALPAAAAAERLMLAWDQCASSYDNSPIAATLEKIAGTWLLDVLDLPRGSGVGFGTSATACTLTCLSAARRSLLARQGWDFDRDGLHGAPEIKVVVPDTVHVTVKKALRLLGFGMARLIVAPTDAWGRIDPDRLPVLDDRTNPVRSGGRGKHGRVRSLPVPDPGSTECGRLGACRWRLWSMGPCLVAAGADRRRRGRRQLDYRRSQVAEHTL
jgi:aromatic-L-amino-acid decarboxylase